MKNFDELYDMYCNNDVRLYSELLEYPDFGYLFSECRKDLAKYYEFRQYLEYVWEF